MAIEGVEQPEFLQVDEKTIQSGDIKVYVWIS